MLANQTKKHPKVNPNRSRDTKQFLVQIRRRISDAANGAPIWESEWEDITEYFVSRQTDISCNLDDTTLQGKIEQDSVILKFNNKEGKFNPEGTENSLWNGTDEFTYHTRLRYYEWNTVDFQYDGVTEPTIEPLMDGLIATEQAYHENFLCDIRINSRLDILRNHFILEETVGRIRSIDVQGILRRIIYLFDFVYPELEIDTTGGVFEKNIVYGNIAPFSSNLLDLFYEAINNSGGVGGLRNNELFITFFGNTASSPQPLQDDGDTTNLYHWDDVDDDPDSKDTNNILIAALDNMNVPPTDVFQLILPAVVAI